MLGTRICRGTALVCGLAALCSARLVADGGPAYWGPPFVTVNGEAFTPREGAPVLMQGELLLPLRDVADALGAELTADPWLPRYTLKRGTTVIEIMVGDAAFRAGDRELNFTLPPVGIGRVVYVDAKDLAIVLGGGLTWDEHHNTADIRVQVFGLGGKVVRGSLVYLLTQPGQPPVFLIREGEQEDPTAYTGASRVECFEMDVNGQVRPSSLDRVRRGDYVQLGLDDTNRVARVLTSRALVRGQVDRVSEGKVWLQDGRQFGLTADTQVRTERGNPYALGALRRGDRVTLTTNPTDGTVVEIVVDLGGASGPGAQPQAPEILLVAPEYRGPLTAGAELKVRLRGTARGTATFDIGHTIRAIPMREVAPGDYVGSYIVQPDDDVINASVIGHLEVAGRQAAEVKSKALVTIDTVVPRFVQVSPGYLQTVDTASPMIQISYGDPEGSGVDPKRVTIALDQNDVTQRATITGSSATYQARDLPVGDHWVHIKIADRAGNAKELRTVFTVQGTPQNKIRAVQHDAQEVLVAGAVLTVTMDVTERGKRAYFTIGNNWRRVDMAWVEGANLYRGRYAVHRGDRAVGALIIGHFVDNDNREHQMEATTPVDILGTLPNALAITTPKDRQKLTQTTLEIVGEAPPNRKVRVLVGYTLPLFGDQTLSLQTVTANSEGLWKSQAVDLMGELGARLVDEFNIVAQLLDDKDRAVEQKRVTVTVER